MDCKIVLALSALCASAALSNQTFDTNIPKHPCQCAKIYAPVCGSDGKTYNTECVMNCHNFEKGTSVTVASQGQCERTVERCACTLEYSPVCANDGKTYGNLCFMLCQRPLNHDIEVVSQGVCPDEVEGSRHSTITKPCNCSQEICEVCGTDGETYRNVCLLECFKNNWYPNLEIEYYGECAKGTENPSEHSD